MEVATVTQARQRLTELVRSLEQPVIITVYGEPRAVLLKYDLYQALLEKIEDLGDSLAVLERRGSPTRDFDEVMAELEGVS